MTNEASDNLAPEEPKVDANRSAATDVYSKTELERKAEHDRYREDVRVWFETQVKPKLKNKQSPKAK